MQNSVRFAQITPTTYDALRAEAAYAGIGLDPLSSYPKKPALSFIETHGCKIVATYDQAAATVVLAVESKPWLFSLDAVLSQLRAVVVNALSAAGAKWSD